MSFQSIPDATTSTKGKIQLAGDLGGAASSPTVTAQTDATGWTKSSYTWVYASSTTFTISGVDLTSVFKGGTRVSYNDGSVDYGIVKSSTFSTNTTVTLVSNNNYSIANTTLSSPRYSYEASPQGFPASFAYTPALTASGSNPTLGSGSTQNGNFSVVGSTVSLWIKIAFGTSGTGAGSGTYFVSMPTSADSAIYPTYGRLAGSQFYDSSSATQYLGAAFFNDNGLGSVGTKISFIHQAGAVVSNSSPWTWAASDEIHVWAQYVMA